ncbi:unnamed protein product [Spirodela intermedia]|uniref:DUF3700 domain-containing protein n=1 Tax=Spirodela intermedia TaxID=51605 RepID=A0A7I8KMQ9_SPIIN|nr:unnamed protein product [Spirodela intermedia]
MLAIFQKTVAHPPQELNSPVAAGRAAKTPEGILRAFHAAHPDDSFSATFTGGAALASVNSGRNMADHRRVFSSLDGIYCLFYGRLDNLSSLIRQYGLCKATNEALFVIEAYRTLRDRSPYPADQVVKDLDGSFAFIIYDDRAGTIFAALVNSPFPFFSLSLSLSLSSFSLRVDEGDVWFAWQSADGRVPLYWGIAADGSVAISDEQMLIKGSCGKSFAPFPTGCMFHSEGGLKSFEHPMNRMKAMPRVDSEGVMCGATFNVDAGSRISAMPRVGSAASWSPWGEAP